HHNQTLHYFPTRRSSDLKIRFEDNVFESNAINVDTAAKTFMLAGLPGIVVHPYSSAVFTGGAQGLPDIVGKHVRVRGRAESDTRSEEHTSELQSLRHLVC